MKKALLILCAAVVAFVSCNKEIASPDLEGKETVEVVFNLSATHPDDTKAVKTAWETGDVVFVFFSKQTAPAYLEMKYDGTKWVNTQKDLAFKNDESGTMTAVYLPFGSKATVSSDGTSYKFSETYLSYYLTGQLPYTVSGGQVSGSFEMKYPDGYVQFFFDEADIDINDEMELREPHLTPQGIASVGADGTINLTTIAHGAPVPGYVYDKENKGTGESKGMLFSAILSDDARYDKTKLPMDYYFTVVAEGWKGLYYSKSFLNQQFYRGAKEGRAFKFPGKGWTLIEDYKPIDLGCDVPVTIGGKTELKRIYWCSRNIGAKSDELKSDFEDVRGGYYAWGEIATKSDYSWVTYKHIVDPPYDTDPDYYWKGISKYTVPFPASHPDKIHHVAWYDSDGTNFIGDNTTVLEPEDDAARQVLGGLWRIPTEAEWQVLNTKPTFDWIWTDINKGIKVYSNVDGYIYTGGPYIYLPAASYWKGDERDPQGLDGYCGHYWTASLYEYDVPSARYFFFNSSNETFGYRDHCEGLQIRAVTD